MNGLLILDKPKGMTSHDVVYRVRRATGEKSVGHLGTLDPMATGVLPLLLGKWTRLAQYFSAAEKVYTGTIRFGWATDTYDAEGQRAGEILPLQKTLPELQELARHFSGEMEQMPPVFSAKKIGGVPAYKLARAGKDVPVKPAKIFIHEFSITSLTDDVAEFRMHVSAGGYVRSVAHELGQMAGCGAHLDSLRRVRAGDFLLENAMTLEAMDAFSGEGRLEASMVHPRVMLPGLPCVTADETSAARLRNGMAVNLPEFSQAPLVKIFTGQRELVGIGKRIAGTLMQPVVNL